jgi:large subunit ribosomal protein L22
MTPSKPGDPQKGKPAEAEQAEVEAQEAKEAAAVEAAAEKAAASEAAADEAVASEADEAADEPQAGTDEDALEPTAEDVRAADEAASEEDLEEGDEDEDESAAEEEPAPKPRRRRTRRAAEPVEEEAAPAPARRREPLAPGERVLVRAQAKYVRTSARKARLVCDHIRGKSVQDARAILAHTPRAVARDWSKLLESAVANAEHNHELLGDDLRIVAVTADEGPTLKRYRPRAMGRATRIRKRTSHLTILLTPKES